MSVEFPPRPDNIYLRNQPHPHRARRTANSQIPGAGIPFIVLQKVSVAALLRCRAARDDVQSDASSNQTGEGVDLLLYKRCLAASAPCDSDNELELRSRLSNGTKRSE